MTSQDTPFAALRHVPLEAGFVPYTVTVSGEIDVVSAFYQDTLGIEGGRLTYLATLDFTAPPRSNYSTPFTHTTYYEITNEQITLAGTPLDGTYLLPPPPAPYPRNALVLYDDFAAGYPHDRLMFSRSSATISMNGNTLQILSTHPFIDFGRDDFLAGPAPTPLPLFDTTDVDSVVFRLIDADNSSISLYELTAISAYSSVIPEPCTFVIWSLLGAFGLAVGWWRRRRKAT